ncbi:MAG TPA: hypothetical protein VN253_11245 [Kofleriaceae bacterium]|nr:hypothetical protein [Kofleriaceae bacterium]
MSLRCVLALALALALALHGCCASHRAPEVPRGDHPPHRPAGVSAIERAGTFLDAQLASILADTLEDHSRLLAHFAPSASVLGEGTIDRAIANLRAGVLAQDPHDEVIAAKVTNLTAGGNDRVVWLQFVLAIEVRIWEHASPESTEDIERRIVRGSELITAANGWRAVAAAFSRPGEPEPRQPALPVADPTERGPLTAFVTDPGLAARSVRDDAAVAVVGFGRGDLAVGSSAARALLDQIGERKPSLQGKPHEVRTADWGFVHANVDLPVAGESLPARGAVQLVALPDAHGAWSVVSVHYAAL